MAAERLQKIIAAAGIASRRKAEELIAAGLVSVNGQTVTELGTKADPVTDDIRVRGQQLHGAERKLYFMLNKPRGYVSTVHDPEGRRTVMDLVRAVGARLFPIGRLDYNSEGLLLLTNDGDLAQRLTHASFHVPKTYMVKVSGKPPEEALARLRSGVTIHEQQEGRSRQVRTAPAKIELVRDAPNPWYEISLYEGRNRQIHRMFEKIGHHVEKIKRVRYGPLELNLEPGEFRALTPGEVKRLQQGESADTSKAPQTHAVRPERDVPRIHADLHAPSKSAPGKRQSRTTKWQKERPGRPVSDRRPRFGGERGGERGQRPNGERGRGLGQRPNGERPQFSGKPRGPRRDNEFSQRGGAGKPSGRRPRPDFGKRTHDRAPRPEFDKQRGGAGKPSGRRPRPDFGKRTHDRAPRPEFDKQRGDGPAPRGDFENRRSPEQRPGAHFENRRPHGKRPGGRGPQQRGFAKGGSKPFRTGGPRSGRPSPGGPSAGRRPGKGFGGPRRGPKR